jgi:hypothetical protein
VSRTPRSRQPCPHFARAIGFLLRGGDVWPEILVPIVSGRAGQPITFGTYRRGRCATISGAPILLPGLGQTLKGTGGVCVRRGNPEVKRLPLAQAPFKRGARYGTSLKCRRRGAAVKQLR